MRKVPNVEYLLTRAISGYVWIIPVIAFYILLLRKKEKEQNVLHILSTFVFCLYLFAIVAATGIGNIPFPPFSPEFRLMPFGDLFGSPMHFILNLVSFVPFGIFLPLMYRQYCHLKRVAFTGFLFSLSIELIQMFGWGVTEVDDLIANTLGVCIGYWIFGLLSRFLPDNFRERFYAKNVNGVIAVFAFSAFTFAIMATLEPLLHWRR